MKLRHLERALSEVKAFASPVAELEQYPTSPQLAAQVVHTIDSTFDDVSGKAVCDLGCGTGILAIAAGIMGAHFVLGVDVDESAINTAAENARELEVDDIVGFCVAEVSSAAFISEQPSTRKFDTVIMNPPFGTKRKGVDMAFLQTAIQISSGAVYSMHKTSTREHISKKAREWGADARVIAELKFDIGHMYQFHRSHSVDVAVDLWRLDVSSMPDCINLPTPSLPPPDELHKRSNTHRQRLRGRNRPRQPRKKQIGRS